MSPLAGRRIAVVLFNLGGPDDQASVKPFLFNLFNDPAIIGLPGIVRTPLARRIAGRREKTAQANYALMGGGSPLLPETREQAAARRFCRRRAGRPRRWRRRWRRGCRTTRSGPSSPCATGRR